MLYIQATLTGIRVKQIQSNVSTVDAGTVDFRNQGLNLFFDKKFLTTGSALNVPGFETFMDIKT